MTSPLPCCLSHENGSQVIKRSIKQFEQVKNILNKAWLVSVCKINIFQKYWRDHDITIALLSLAWKWEPGHKKVDKTVWAGQKYPKQGLAGKCLQNKHIPKILTRQRRHHSLLSLAWKWEPGHKKVDKTVWAGQKYPKQGLAGKCLQNKHIPKNIDATMTSPFPIVSRVNNGKKKNLQHFTQNCYYVWCACVSISYSIHLRVKHIEYFMYIIIIDIFILSKMWCDIIKIHVVSSQTNTAREVTVSLIRFDFVAYCRQKNTLYVAGNNKRDFFCEISPATF